MPNNENTTVNETILTGKKYRVLKDKVHNLWNRISFWTSANDVEFTDSGVLQGKRLNEVVLDISNGGGMPTGTIATFDGTTLPPGFEPYTTAEQTAIQEINDNLSGQDYVELITSGQTYSSAIDTLFSMINKNKIQPGKSCLRFNSAVLHVVDYSDVQIIASRTYVNYLNKLVTDSFTFYVNNSKFVNKTDNDIFDNSSKATTGATLRFIY